MKDETIAYDKMTAEEMAAEVRALTEQLHAMGRNDMLLKAIGVPMLEELRIEAARGQLSRLLITHDFRFFLLDYERKEVVMQPVHKAVYLLFLAHPEGIEFKQLSDYRDELLRYYRATARLTNPLDNAIHEKCSRIRKIFEELMDEYSACYYHISSHTKRHVGGSSRTWYERLKLITLPRELVVWE